MWSSCFHWFNSLLGCGLYFNDQRLLQVPAVDLTRPKPKTDQTFRFNAADCTLSGKDFHDYSGFQSSWKNINDNFFILEKKGGNSYEVNVSLGMFNNFGWILAIINRKFKQNLRAVAKLSSQRFFLKKVVFKVVHCWL